MEYYTIFINVKFNLILDNECLETCYWKGLRTLVYSVSSHCTNVFLYSCKVQVATVIIVEKSPLICGFQQLKGVRVIEMLRPRNPGPTEFFVVKKMLLWPIWFIRKANNLTPNRIHLKITEYLC